MRVWTRGLHSGLMSWNSPYPEEPGFEWPGIPAPVRVPVVGEWYHNHFFPPGLVLGECQEDAVVYAEVVELADGGGVPTGSL